MAPISPDPTPTKNLWGLLKARVKISQPYARDLQDLQASAETFWKKYVRSETLKNLIKSGPGQIKSVIKAESYFSF